MNDRRIEQLSLENFKLKKEKKRLQKLLKDRTEEMLEKFLKSENKIKLGGTIDGNKNIRNLTHMIVQTRVERENASKVEATNQTRIKELEEEINSFNNELKKLSEDTPSGKSFHNSFVEMTEGHMRNQKLIVQLNKDIKKAEKEKKKLEAVVDAGKTLEKREEMFKEAIDELKAYITKDYLSKNENEVEHLVKEFYDKFKKIVETDFDLVAQKNPEMGGAFDILKESNGMIRKIERENKIVKKREDVTYEIYKMIKEIFTDNILLRKKVNKYLEAFLKQTENSRMRKY